MEHTALMNLSVSGSIIVFGSKCGGVLGSTFFRFFKKPNKFINYATLAWQNKAHDSS